MKKTSQPADEKTGSGIKLPAYWTFLRQATPRRSVRDIRQKFETDSTKDVADSPVKKVETHNGSLSAEKSHSANSNGALKSERIQGEVSSLQATAIDVSKDVLTPGNKEDKVITSGNIESEILTDRKAENKVLTRVKAEVENLTPVEAKKKVSFREKEDNEALSISRETSSEIVTPGNSQIKVSTPAEPQNYIRKPQKSQIEVPAPAEPQNDIRSPQKTQHEIITPKREKTGILKDNLNISNEDSNSSPVKTEDIAQNGSISDEKTLTEDSEESSDTESQILNDAFTSEVSQGKSSKLTSCEGSLNETSDLEKKSSGDLKPEKTDTPIPNGRIASKSNIPDDNKDLSIITDKKEDKVIEKAQNRLLKSELLIEQLQQNLATQVSPATVQAYNESIRNKGETEGVGEAPAKPARVSWTTRLIQKLTEEENRKKTQKAEPKLLKPKRIVRFPQKKADKPVKREWPKFYPGLKAPVLPDDKKQNVSGIRLDEKGNDGYACLISKLAEDGDKRPVGSPVTREEREARQRRVEEIRAELAREECAVTSSDEDSDVITMKEKPSGIRRLLPHNLFSSSSSSKKDEYDKPAMEPLLKRGDRVYPAGVPRPVHETAFLSRSQSASPARRYVQENEHNSSRSKSVSPARDRKPALEIRQQPLQQQQQQQQQQQHQHQHQQHHHQHQHQHHQHQHQQPHQQVSRPHDAYYHSPPSRRKASAGSSASSSSTLVADAWYLENQAITGSPDIRRLQQQRHYGEIRQVQVPSGRLSAPPYHGDDYPKRRVTSPEPPRNSSRRSSSQPPKQRNSASAQVKMSPSSGDANCKETQTAKSYIQQNSLSAQEALHRKCEHNPAQIQRSLTPNSLERHYQNSTAQRQSLSPPELAHKHQHIPSQHTTSPQESLYRQQHSPAQPQRSLTPNSYERQYQNVSMQRNSLSPPEVVQKHQRNLSPNSQPRQHQKSPNFPPQEALQRHQQNQKQQIQRSLSPNSLQRQYQNSPVQGHSPSQQNQSPQEAIQRRQLQRSLSPNSQNRHYQNSPIQGHSPSQYQRSISPASLQRRQYQNSPVPRDQSPSQLHRSLSPNSLIRQYQKSPAEASQHNLLSPDTLHKQQNNQQQQQLPPRQYQNSPVQGHSPSQHMYPPQAAPRHQQVQKNQSPSNSLQRPYQSSPVQGHSPPQHNICPPEVVHRHQKSQSPSNSLQRQYQNSPVQGSHSPLPIQSKPAQYRKLSRQEVEALYWETQRLRAGLSSLSQHFASGDRYMSTNSLQGAEPIRPAYRVHSVQNVGGGYGSLIVKPQPVCPRARSVSPSPDRHLGTRSLSLPRDANFSRGTPQRNTIGPIRTQPATPTIFEEGEEVQLRHPHKNNKKKSHYAPIFKRGSLTSPVEDTTPSQYPKRVSFNSSSEPLYWPTRNGPAPEPPTRQRKSGDSDVFFPDDYNTYANLPATMQAPNRPLPPVPRERKNALPPAAQRWQQQSESESGSEAGEVQRILQQGSHGRGTYFRFQEEEWGADGKSRGAPGADQSVSNVGRDDEVRRSGGGGGRSGRRDEPRRHTLSGDHHHHQQGGALARSMDLESPLPRGYPPPSSAMLFDDDPGIMSEVETSSTGFRRGGKQRSSLPVVRTPSKTLERPLGLVFLQYRSETKRALLPNEITSIDTVKALFVRSFPKQLTMEYMDSPHVKIYIHDSSKDMFYELEDLRSHLRDIRDRSVLRLFESTDMNGGVLPGAGVGVVAPPMWDQDQSYFSEPEFDSEYQHQHIHKTKASSKSGSSGGVPPQAPYYMTHSYPPGGGTGAPGASATLPRGGPLLRAYSPAVAPPVPGDRMKTLPQTDRLHAESGYMSSPERGGPRAYPTAAYPPGGPGYEDPYYSQYASRSGSITPVIDEEASDTELIDESYSLYGVKLPTAGRSVVTPQPRGQFPAPAVVPYDATRIRVEHMERQLANLTGLVQKALTQTPTPREYLQVPPPASARDANYRNDDSYLRTDTKPPKLGKDKSVSFEKSVSFSDEPPDMNSPKQHSPQHAERTERDRHKPAPPPKPVSLSPGQYEGRHVYRDLQLTPEMYNQLRGLQKKAKDLRQEVRNLRRMSQAQAHSVRETIRDTFMKIRAMLLIGGEESWALAGDADKLRLNREEDSYKQEMLRLEKDLTELESTVEELRGNVINRKTRVNMSDVENMALILSKSSKTVADLKVRFPGLQEGMKGLLASEMEKVVREEKFLKEEPERLESALRRCKKLTGTLVTLKRLASVQEQRLPPTSGTDSRLSPTMGISGGESDTPITPPAHGKPGAIPARGVVAATIGGDSTVARQRPENALDALLDELQTFARPPSRGHNPPMADIGRKGSIDSAHTLPASSGTSSLRRLHSYPSSSDGGGNSPPTVALSRLQVSGSTAADAPKSPATSPKPPVPERNSELLSQLAGRRVPPPPPPRTSSRSPLASPTSPSLPPRGQHPPSQPQMGIGGGTLLRRGGPGRSSLREPLRAPPSAKQEELSQSQPGFNPASNSSSCESINSQEGLQAKSATTTTAGNKARQEILEQRHQELLRKQRALQEQYARLQQLQRGGGGSLAVVPPPDLLLKKTGSESNLLAKMGLGHGLSAAAPISGSLTHLAAVANQQPLVSPKQAAASTTTTSTTTATTTTTTTTTTNKIYETDIL